MTNNNENSNDIIDVIEEVRRINEEMDSLVTTTIPLTKYDFMVSFFAGVMGGLCDIFIGKPGGYEEPKIKNDSFLGLGKKMKEYDLKNNPIDAPIPGAKVGDHRLYSYGHDVVRFFKSAKVVQEGKGDIGIHGLGGKLPPLEEIPNNYKTPDSYWQAILVLLLHLYKDFWTKRSLPIPGNTLIADLNGHKMPETIHKLTNEHEVNLRQLSGQVLSVSVIEITIRMWHFFQSYNTDFDKSQIKHKQNKMLTLGHSIAMLFNLGKVVVTKNPFFLNVPQIIRIITLTWKIVKENQNLTHNAKVKANLGVLKNKYETLETMVILENGINYVKNTDEKSIEKLISFNKTHQNNKKDIQKGFNEIDDLLKNYPTFN